MCAELVEAPFDRLRAHLAGVASRGVSPHKGTNAAQMGRFSLHIRPCAENGHRFASLFSAFGRHDQFHSGPIARRVGAYLSDATGEIAEQADRMSSTRLMRSWVAQED